MTLIRKERIYFDSSVIGGYYDEEFSEESKRVIEYAREGRIIVLMSEIVIQEILKAPLRVQEVLTSLPSVTLERIELTPEIISLRDAYLAATIVAPRWTDDATHVAAATIARADALVSWNFSHIVRLDKMRAYNMINLLQGYGILTIISPKRSVMTTQQRNKEFDCIASKREAQDQIYQETKEMSPDQQIQYFRNAVENSRLGGWWKKAKSFSGNHVNKAS